MKRQRSEKLWKEARELRWIQAVSPSAAARQWRWSIVGAVRREESRQNEMLIMIDSGSDENCAPKWVLLRATLYTSRRRLFDVQGKTMQVQGSKKLAISLVPLNPEERRFALASVDGRVYVFNVLVFGSGSAPTVWGRFAAFLGSAWMTICDPNHLRVQIYVDDPFFLLRGLRRVIAVEASLALLWTGVLGFPFSWR